MCNTTLQKSIASVLAPSPMPWDVRMIAKRLRRQDLGAVPYRSIYSCVENALRADGETCEFLKMSPGTYMLRKNASSIQLSIAADRSSTEPKFHEGELGIITCYGSGWPLNSVKWGPSPKIVGRQMQSSKPVDFGQQVGFYALHTQRGDISYFGYTLDTPIGTCMYNDMKDRFIPRCGGFSFFGLLPVTDDGVVENRLPENFNVADTVVSLASLITELVRPLGNRPHHDCLSTREFNPRDVSQI